MADEVLPSGLIVARRVDDALLALRSRVTAIENRLTRGIGAPLGTGAAGDRYYDTSAGRSYESDGIGWVVMDEPDQVFTSYSVAASSGTITTVGTKLGRYKRRGGYCIFTCEFIITTNGTGAVTLLVGVPVQALSSGGQAFVGAGREIGVTGKALTATVGAGGTTASLQFYDNSYPGANSAAPTFTIEYPMVTRYS